MGCGCSKKPVLQKSTYLFVPVLDDMHSTAQNFELWELVLSFLSPESLRVCRRLNRRFYRTIVVPLNQKPVRLKRVSYSQMMISAYSLMTSADSFKVGRDESAVMTPIGANRSPGSPFFTEFSIKSVPNVPSRSPTPFGGSFKFVEEFRPVTDDLEEVIRMGDAGALQKLLIDLVDRSCLSLCITRKNDDVEFEMTLLGLVVLTGSNHMTELVLNLLENVDIEDGITIKRTEVSDEDKIYAGAVKVSVTKLSPLKLAASRGFDRIVSSLLVKGADAVKEGSLISDRLISITETDNGPSPLAFCLQSYFKVLPFSIGVEIVHPVSDWFSCVEQLLLSGAKPGWDECLLCLDDLEMLRLIVRYCSDIEDLTGMTLLEVASVHGKHQAVDVLIDAGYKVTSHAMLSCPYIKIEQFAKVYTGQPSVTYLAIKACDFRMLNRLVGLGYKISLEEVYNGYNCLHLIAQQKSNQLLTILKLQCSLEDFAKATTAKAYGGTVMWFALPDLVFLKEMLSLGGSIDDLNFVHVFRTYYRNQNLISRLIDLGIDIEATDEAGLTAFWHAYADAKWQQQRSLKSYGANIDCRNSDGYTPLLDACLKGLYLQAKLLIEFGADTSLTTPQGLEAYELVHMPHRLKNMKVLSKLSSLLTK
jgi:ankyrin repeat protein